MIPYRLLHASLPKLNPNISKGFAIVGLQI